jgi:hypothetical protein
VSAGDKVEINEGQTNHPRRTFRWPGLARQMVRAYVSGVGAQADTPDGNDYQALRALITNLVAVSGNPRRACWRFVRQSGLSSKRSYRQWTRAEQQKLLDLIASHSLYEVTTILRRSPTSVRTMLHRLGANARMGEDWFTKYALARALHIRVEEIQKWIDQGRLKARTLRAEGLRREVIDAEDFCQKAGGRLQNRLSCFRAPSGKIMTHMHSPATNRASAEDRRTGRALGQQGDESGLRLRNASQFPSHVLPRQQIWVARTRKSNTVDCGWQPTAFGISR